MNYAGEQGQLNKAVFEERLWRAIY